MPERHAQRQRALVVALLASMLLWNLPFAGLVFYPFKLLATWMHEMSHGVVMLLSGAGFDHMEIYRDTSGLAYAETGTGAIGRAAIAGAGYMGTPVIGAVLLVLGQTRRGARSVLAVLGVALALSAIFFVRNGFGIAAVGIGAGACLIAALLSGDTLATLLVNFLAAQACINAVLDIRVLFRTNLVVNGEVMGASDAHNMAAATFGDAWMWACIWLGWSLVVLFAALRLVYLRQRRISDAPTTAVLPDGSDYGEPSRSPA